MRHELKESQVRLTRWAFWLLAVFFLSPAVLVLTGYEELGWEYVLALALLCQLSSHCARQASANTCSS